MHRYSLITFSLLVASLSAAGCASLIGLNERPLVETDDTGGEGGAPGTGGAQTNPNEVIDKETGKTTNQLCIDYCDAVMENCPIGTEFQQYPKRELCINTCNHLPEGDIESTGNTVTCRLQQAQVAATYPDETCAAAGPGGEDTCGSNCTAWCGLLEDVCPDQHGLMVDCEQNCSGLRDDGNLAMRDSTPDAPNLQCRLYHLGAAVDIPETHCPHSQYLPNLHCFEDTKIPDCTEYCNRIMANCPETGDVKTNAAVYDSHEECEAVCKVFEPGTIDDRKVNTLGCHYYHAGLASVGRAPHCAHAGPPGEGACLPDTEKDGQLVSSQNCDSYCNLYKNGCAEDFASRYNGQDECVLDCATNFASKGARTATDAVRAEGSPFYYVVDFAPLTDTLQCRIYHSVKAIAGNADACGQAALNAPCGR